MKDERTFEIAKVTEASSCVVGAGSDYIEECTVSEAYRKALATALRLFPGFWTSSNSAQLRLKIAGQYANGRLALDLTPCAVSVSGTPVSKTLDVSPVFAHLTLNVPELPLDPWDIIVRAGPRTEIMLAAEVYVHYTKIFEQKTVDVRALCEIPGLGGPFATKIQRWTILPLEAWMRGLASPEVV